MFDIKTPGEHAAEVGQRLQALRLQRNIPQAWLAKQAGVSRPTLGALETRGKGTLETLARLMFALGRELELDTLLRPDPPSTLEEAAAPPPRRQRARGS